LVACFATSEAKAAPARINVGLRAYDLSPLYSDLPQRGIASGWGTANRVMTTGSSVEATSMEIGPHAALLITQAATEIEEHVDVAMFVVLLNARID
jgi:hypothetical protein